MHDGGQLGQLLFNTAGFTRLTDYQKACLMQEGVAGHGK